MSARLTKTDLAILNEALAMLEADAEDEDRYDDRMRERIDRVRRKVWDRLGG